MYCGSSGNTRSPPCVPDAPRESSLDLPMIPARVCRNLVALRPMRVLLISAKLGSRWHLCRALKQLCRTSPVIFTQLGGEERCQLGQLLLHTTALERLATRAPSIQFRLDPRCQVSASAPVIRSPDRSLSSARLARPPSRRRRSPGGRGGRAVLEYGDQAQAVADAEPQRLDQDRHRVLRVFGQLVSSSATPFPRDAADADWDRLSSRNEIQAEPFSVVTTLGPPVPTGSSTNAGSTRQKISSKSRSTA